MFSQLPEKISFHREKTISIIQSQNIKKEYREVGTQNSQQTILTKLNFPRLRTKSKGKIHRLKHKKPRSVKSHKSDQKNEPKSPTSIKSIAVAKKVSETKKAKLEIDTKINDFSNDGDSSQTFSNPVSDSFLSNTSSTATTDATNEKLPDDNQDLLETLCSKMKMEEKEPTKVKNCEEKPNQKQWDIIENVLSRVNQKEKESLWDDIRDFVKTKIGRDINDEGAKEVCIEIEQDFPKHKKGECNSTAMSNEQVGGWCRRLNKGHYLYFDRMG